MHQPTGHSRVSPSKGLAIVTFLSPPTLEAATISFMCCKVTWLAVSDCQ